MSDERLYVITRRDMPASVQAVQSIHAAIQLVSDTSLKFTETPWVIVYGVANEAELAAWEKRLNGRGTSFREPDMGNELTAISYWGKKHSGMGGLRLL